MKTSIETEAILFKDLISIPLLMILFNHQLSHQLKRLILFPTGKEKRESKRNKLDNQVRLKNWIELLKDLSQQHQAFLTNLMHQEKRGNLDQGQEVNLDKEEIQTNKFLKLNQRWIKIF